MLHKIGASNSLSLGVLWCTMVFDGPSACDCTQGSRLTVSEQVATALSFESCSTCV